MSASAPPRSIPQARIQVAPGCVLRPWQDSDLAALLAAASDPDVGRWTNRPEPFDLAAAEKFLTSTSTALATSQAVFLGIWEGDVLRGGVGATYYPSAAASPPQPLASSERTLIELGYWLTAPARGRGLARAALGAFITWLEAPVRSAELPRQLFVRIEAANAPSLRLAARCGFELALERDEPGLHGEPEAPVRYLTRPPAP